MKFDKEELIRKIREAEGLSNEDKSALLGLLNEKKTYGLVWEDSTEDAFEQLRTQLPILREVKDRQIVNDTESEHYPNHILIEGENLQALVALTYTHAGMVDVIYIDPPYNTGNKDFAYYDDFCDEYRQIPYVEREDSYRHSKWLSFMERRLKIAKTLLSDNGVIFISIDDNEQSQLKLLCDEIFGYKNYLNHFVWLVNITGRQISGTGAAKTWESILVYSKRVESLIPFYIPITMAKTLMPDAYKGFNKDIRRDELGEFAIGDTLYNHNRKFNEETRPNLVFSIYYNPLTQDIIPDDMGKSINGYVEIPPHPNGDGVHKHHAWRWSRKKVQEESYNLIVLPKGKDDFEIYTRIRDFNTTILKDIITNISNGDTELQQLLGGKFFDYPKSVNLLKILLNANSNKNSIILDFFAGSGTTMHATMQLNAEDGGHRQCILVTNNENGICENVTYERNKRVIEGYKTPKGDYVEGLKANNLRYYKVDFKGRKQSHQSNRDLAMNLKDLLCIKEDIYTEQKQFGALSLSGKEQMLRYFAEDGRGMLMVYDTRVIPFITKEIEKMDLKEQPLKIYIFADGAHPYTDDFASVIDKVSLIPMPYAYHRAIKDVLPEEDATKVDDTDLTSEEQKEMMAKAIEAENKEKKED